MSAFSVPLTPVQQAIVEEFKRRARRGEPPPTYRELCELFGWASSASARDHLRSLERKGLLVHTARIARSFRLADSGTGSLAVLGRVVAGRPEAAIREHTDQVSVPSSWIDRGAVFALRVYGDSMSGAGILENDVVVCSLTPPKPGDIVAATLQNETTLKRLTKDRQGRFWLAPENSKYQRIAVNDAETIIHGVVVGLLRDFQPMKMRESR